MKRFIRRLCNSLRYLCGMPIILEPQNCSREQPHDGPCNGWPCNYRLKQMAYDEEWGRRVCDLDLVHLQSGAIIKHERTTDTTKIGPGWHTHDGKEWVRSIRVGFENWRTV